jgi:hypothetical protein
MPMMFAGDFNQLGPVLKDFIPTSMMLFAKRHKMETGNVPFWKQETQNHC